MDVAAVRLAEHDWSAKQISKEKQVPSIDRQGVNVIDHCFRPFWPIFCGTIADLLENQCFDYFSTLIAFSELI
jgi:hypothetical protein